MSGAKTMRRDGVLRTIERAPLGPILAPAFAAAVAFALYAMPGGRPAMLPMALGAAVGGGSVLALFAWLEHPRGRDAVTVSPRALVAVAHDRLRALWDTSRGAGDELAVPALRRADAHPDAPARRPIFAAADLGARLDEAPVAGWRDEAPVRPAASSGDAPRIGGADELLLELPIAAFEPPAPAVALSANQLMTRLETGLARRGGGSPTDMNLRDALRRLQTAHG